MNRILAIAINTFREAVRDRVLYGVFAFAVAVLVFTLALAELSLEQQERVVMDLGLASISFFGVVIAVFLGSSLLYKEIEKKTLYVILPKPIHRWEFLVGKFLGIVLTGFVFVATMGAVQLGVASAQAGVSTTVLGLLIVAAVAALVALVVWAEDASAHVVPWAFSVLAAFLGLAAYAGVSVQVTAMALVLCLCEVMVLAAVAMLFSSFSSPFLTGLFTAGLWLVGRSGDEMAAMKSDVLPDSVKQLLRGLVEVVPNFHLFVPGRNALVADVGGGPWVYTATTVAYACFYALALMALAALVFRRRDFL